MAGYATRAARAVTNQNLNNLASALIAASIIIAFPVHRRSDPRAARHCGVAGVHSFSGDPPAAPMGAVADTCRRSHRRERNRSDRRLEHDHRRADHAACRRLAEVRGQLAHEGSRIERCPIDLGGSRPRIRHAAGLAERDRQAGSCNPWSEASAAGGSAATGAQRARGAGQPRAASPVAAGDDRAGDIVPAFHPAAA